jgi:hypothetical protein
VATFAVLRDSEFWTALNSFPREALWAEHNEKNQEGENQQLHPNERRTKLYVRQRIPEGRRVDTFSVLRGSVLR